MEDRSCDEEKKKRIQAATKFLEGVFAADTQLATFFGTDFDDETFLETVGLNSCFSADELREALKAKLEQRVPLVRFSFSESPDR